MVEVSFQLHNWTLVLSHLQPEAPGTDFGAVTSEQKEILQRSGVL
jgi:hypothetical protein